MSCVSVAQNQLHEKVHKLFYRLGYLAGSCSVPFILIPILLTVIGATGLLKFGEINDIKVQFTPLNSPSVHESKVAGEFFFKNSSKSLSDPVLVTAIDEGNLLRDGYSQDILDLLEFLKSGLTVTHEGKKYRFKNLCHAHCGRNKPVEVFLRAYNQKAVRNSPNVKLRYPTMELLANRVFIGSHLFGVKTAQDGTIIYVEAMSFALMMPVENPKEEIIARLWQEKLLNFSQYPFRDRLKIRYQTAEFVQSEIRRTGITAVPYFALSFLLILLFSLVTTMRSNCAQSKPWEVLAGVMSPFLAIITAFGILMHVGLSYQPIVTVSLFLVLAIGVDDMYLMLAAWHKTDPEKSVPERTGLALAHAGPSISITSFTNALSFGIGTLSPTPAIRTFCCFTAIAITIDYVYQLTFFAGVVALSGRRERKQQNFCFCCLKSNHPKTPLFGPLAQLYGNVLAGFVKVLVSWPARILLAIVLFGYWSVAVWGCTTMRVDLDVDKLLLEDSPVLKMREMERRYETTSCQTLFMFVSSPGDLRLPHRAQQLMALADEVERSSEDHMVGRDSTFFWLRDYSTYQRFFSRTVSVNGTEPFSYRHIRIFLKANNYAFFKGQMKLDHDACDRNEPACVKEFFFTTSYTNITGGWSEQVNLLSNWRAIAAKYADFNVTSYILPNFIVDQVASVGPITRNTVIFTMLCMTASCALFVPDLISTCLAVSAVLSINLGVFGYLALWNVDLDPISMAGLLMAIGFSIDFTAHITYHYAITHKEEPSARLLKAFQSIAWPMTQAGMSTIICASVLAIHQSYMITTFVKTVLLVVLLGLTHGLIVLPILLTTLTCYSTQLTCWGREQRPPPLKAANLHTVAPLDAK